ncbi:hypothetical protein [Bradyrhizobium sp. STM 3562]|uniref:hypothetical protein n=1 Tax=Bradyrhizobium sp. STM 3562 TaxID=578924 RepID=UPI00388FE88D
MHVTQLAAVTAACDKLLLHGPQLNQVARSFGPFSADLVWARFWTAGGDAVEEENRVQPSDLQQSPHNDLPSENARITGCIKGAVSCSRACGEMKRDSQRGSSGPDTSSRLGRDDGNTLESGDLPGSAN